jgi:hypothetical protein
MVSFIGQMHSLVFDVAVRIGVDEVCFTTRKNITLDSLFKLQPTQSLPLDRPTAWHQRVARTLSQLVNQDRIEAAENRLMEQQGMSR